MSYAQSKNCHIKGVILDENKNPIHSAVVKVAGSNMGTKTHSDGSFDLQLDKEGNYQIIIHSLGAKTIKENITINSGETIEKKYFLQPNNNELYGVEVFGHKNKQPEKLDAITRLPLKPNEQIQSISIISDKLINEQGALSISDATRNAPGVYTYATYGNMRESISSRGFRGIPVLKNGVRVHSDFRGQGFITDLEGVESIQVLKGANAITMGAATDLGSPGGIVNIVTKTPRFENGGTASLRVGSWGQVRPSFDIYGSLDKHKTLAFRLNGVYEKVDNYRVGVGMNKFYINPSLEWRPNNKTSIILETDYLNDTRTPDAGTVNLSTSENKIYDLPFQNNLGWNTNRAFTKNSNIALRFKREINDNMYVRAAVFSSTLDADAITTSLSQFLDSTGNGFAKPSNIVKRSLNHSGTRLDKNTVIQLDLVGKDVKTGFLKHTFQVGFDFRTSYANSKSYKALLVDTVDIFSKVNNKLPASTKTFATPSEVISNDIATGLMAQDVISFNSWSKIFLGARFSNNQSTSATGNGSTNDNYINPLFGFMVSPTKNINLFASYTNSTNPRTAEYVDINGNALGNERINQVEVGVKSEWLNKRLRFNVTAYQINNKNMNLRATMVDSAGVVIQLPYYFKGGNDERKGVEIELAGKVLPELEVVAGYAYIDARYKEHTTFVPGSKPNNTPSSTANFWANYSFNNSSPLKGLAAGLGAYYISSRPNNDWTLKGVDYHAIVPNKEPWNMKSYTTLNFQVSYHYKNYGVRLLVNNVLDAVGYNAYRTSFINRIDPRNFAAIFTYYF